MKVVVFVLFFCAACSSHSDKSWERLFLENVMIREEGLYVLMGSKPMSTFDVENAFPETLDEIERAFSEQKKRTREDRDCFVRECQNARHCHHRTMWLAAQEMLKNVSPRYRFVARKQPFGESRGGLFINVPNTLLALQRYYPEFSQIAGGDYDPERVLDEISDENSTFWNRLFKSNYAQGLLLGYGRQNSIEFHWQMKNVSLPQLSVEIKQRQEKPVLGEKIAVADLRLPPISVYSLADETMEKYRRERSRIIKEFQGKDFEELVKAWLLFKPIKEVY